MRPLILSAFLAAAAVTVACGTPDDSRDPVTGVNPDPGTPTGSTSSTTGTPSGTFTVPTSTWACRTDIPAGDLHGSYPAEELELPEFDALNYDETERHRPDLLNKVTVIWFYPAASTAG